jgi:Xaa-Pro dipeptidase
LAEADIKRAAVLAASHAAGRSAGLATSPATVRWLLCGRGRPVSSSSPEAAYAVLVGEAKAYVLYQDIESSRVGAEERLQELGYEPMAFPWHGRRDDAVAGLLNGTPPLAGPELDRAVKRARCTLQEPERERYRAGGADAAEAMVETVRRLASADSEQDAAAELAFRARRRGFTTPVVLVAGEEGQKVHRHPLPTGARLGRHALLALTAEREGLHVSLTRLVSFGAPPSELAELVQAAAEIDAEVLQASRPGRTLGEAFAVLERARRVGLPGSGASTTRAVSPATTAARPSPSPETRP